MAVSKALDKSDLGILKIQCKHRDEIDALKDKHQAEIAALAAEVSRLKEQKQKIAFNAARILCPKKKLAEMDALWE